MHTTAAQPQAATPPMPTLIPLRDILAAAPEGARFANLITETMQSDPHKLITVLAAMPKNHLQLLLGSVVVAANERGIPEQLRELAAGALLEQGDMDTVAKVVATRIVQVSDALVEHKTWPIKDRDDTRIMVLDTFFVQVCGEVEIEPPFVQWNGDEDGGDDDTEEV